MTMADGTVCHLGDPEAAATAEMRINDRDFFRRCAMYGNVGFGESYVDGDWDTPDIAAVIAFFIKNIARTPKYGGSSGKVAFTNVLKLVNRAHHLLRPNSVTTSRRNISEHYDLGNAFYSLWLDETMTYSSALFADSEHAEELIVLGSGWKNGG